MNISSADIVSVRALARRHETVHCGRTTVWHEWGRGAPLVLLHGGSGAWTHWLRNLLPLCERGYRVVVPDIPGFGESDIAADEGGDARGTIVPLLDGLDQIVQSPFPLVGFSFGAMVAVLMAVARPERVSRLVLVSPPGLGLRNEGQKLIPWRHLVDAAAVDAAHRHNLAVHMLHRPATIDECAIAIHGANLARDRMRGRRLAQTDVVLSALPGVSCKVDAIFGTHDALYHAQLNTVEALLRAAPGFGSLGLIPNAGHWVQYEQAERFNSELLRLLNQRVG